MGNTASGNESDGDIIVNQKDIFEQSSSSSATSEIPAPFLSPFAQDENGCDVNIGNEQNFIPQLDLSSLFEISLLRNMAAKVPEEMPENILQQHQEHLSHWLEEVLQRNQETVTLAQFYDALLSRSVDRNECIKIFQQFDCEGEGFVDTKLMLDFLKKCNGSAQFSDHSSIIRTFQSCSYSPGFIDIYNEDKESIDHHAGSLLKFIVKNRISSVPIPYMTLKYFNNIISMRSSVLRNHFAHLKKSNAATQKDVELLWSNSKAELNPVTKCITSYEVSSNKADGHRLFLSESSYWQSDGSARSHWIRLRMKSNVIIKRLSIGVASTDQSYMPMLVAILVGRDVNDLHEIKETKIPAHLTGDAVLLENAKVHYPFIQINIKRCYNEGCDTRIHNIKMLGYRPAREQGITAFDAACGWLLQVISDTAVACLPTTPSLRISILEHTRYALDFMPPLSMSPGSSDRPSCISSYVLKEVDAFLQKMATDSSGKLSNEALDVLLSFSLTQGHLVSALRTLMLINESDSEELEMGKLLCNLNEVIGSFWKKHGQQLNMVVVGCDGGQKDDTSSASNVLNSPWLTSQPYLSGDGHLTVNMFFRGQDLVQLTKLRIKIDKGDKGPKSGMVFVYNHEGEFRLKEHVKRFGFADGWRQSDYNNLKELRKAGISSEHENPVAYFTFTDDWDEVEVILDAFPVGQYVLVKFLEPKQISAERLSIVGIKFFGFDRRNFQMGTVYDIMNTSEIGKLKASPGFIMQKALSFFVALARDQSVPAGQNSMQILNMTDLSMKILWEFYGSIKSRSVEAGLVLQLMHAVFPYLSNVASKDQEATEAFFRHLCELVDSTASMNDSTASHCLIQSAKEVIKDGAAVFFPNKESRCKKLFGLIKDINETNEAPSVILTFQSLCQFFSNVDPSSLLELPSSPLEDFDTSRVMQVMVTLVSVAYRECLAIIETEMLSEKSSHLVHLLCSLQTNLMMWCCCQMESENKCRAELAETVIKNYVALISAKVSKSLDCFKKCTVSQMMLMVNKLKDSFLYSTFSQLVLILCHLCCYMDSVKKMDLMEDLMPIVAHLHDVSVKLPDVFPQVDNSFWQQMEQDEEVLRVWELESSHNYENNLNVVQVFSCPGASTFLVEFDTRCETEKRYDYLEFTDARGNKTKYDQKVNTEKWPLRVSFSGGSRLQFVFHSDSSNNEWGYKFKVTAKGNSDIALSWMFDLYLNLSKLIGQFCGSSLDITKVLPNCDGYERKDDLELEFLQSELWSTLFQSGYQKSSLRKTQSGVLVYDTKTSSAEFILTLLDGSNEEAKQFLLKCKELHFRNNQNPCLGSDAVNEAVVQVFCSLLWHTQSLHEDLSKCAEAKGNCKPSDGIMLAYSSAENLRRSFMAVERNQDKSTTEVQNATKSFDALANMKEKALFLLRFSGMATYQAKYETKLKLDRKVTKFCKRTSSLNSDKVSKQLQTESTFDKYPSFRLILDFIRDPAWSVERVEHLLYERARYAKSTASVFSCLVKFLRIISDDSTNIFQIPVVLVFQELLQYQEKFPRHYSHGLDGCGKDLEERVRDSFHDFVRYLVRVVDVSSKTGLHRHDEVQCYDYIEACALHFLGVSWQLCDLPLVEELKLVDIYYRLAIASLAVHEEISLPVDEETELEEYRTTMLWLDECQKTGFTQWHERHKKDNKKAVQLFSARYNEVLDVEVNCGGCGTTLPGGRYRCLQCASIDVCASCYADGIVPADGHCVDHDLMHFLFCCDGCQGFITGTRIHCNVCDDFDLCLGCHQTNHYPIEKHKPEHSFVLFAPKQLTLVKSTSSVLKSYIHNHVWLLFSSLALSTTNIVCSKQEEHENSHAAILLYNRFIHILTKCCMLTSISTMPLVDGNEEDERLRIMQEEAFVQHSQQRIMGLLGAMIPERSKANFTEDIVQVFVSEDFVNVLFSIASGETGRDCNVQHFALGLIGQVLQKIPSCCKVYQQLRTSSLGYSSDFSESEFCQMENSNLEIFKTVDYLFHLGASCLERSGLEWTNTMTTILQKLFVLPLWHDVLLKYLNESVEKLRKNIQTPSLSSVFALYVIAGFPEVFALGSLVRYTEAGMDSKFGIILKHFPDKNRTLVVDCSSRRRQNLKDICIEVIGFNNCIVSESNLVAFASIIKALVTKMKQNEQYSVEVSWVLYLVLKAVLKGTNSLSAEDNLAILYESEFIQCIVHLAGLGTGFSKQWLMSDLEVLSLMLYIRTDDRNSNVLSAAEEALQSSIALVTPSSDESTVDPLEDLDHLARQTFNTLHANLHVPMSVLRALYETRGCNTDELIIAVHENLRKEDGFSPSEDILKLSKKWEEPRTRSSADTEADKAIDFGLQVMSMPHVKEKKVFDGKAAEEPMTESQRLIVAADSNIKVKINRQRCRNSAALLRKELERERSGSAKDFLIRVNNALSILYARQVLTALLADKSISQHVISAALIGCRMESDLPYVLDLLNRPESQETFSRMVENVIRHCKPDGLVTVATIACEFMEEFSLMTIVKQSSSSQCTSDELFQDKIHIPGALFLSIQFDSRCFTEENDVKLIMSSSADYKQDRRMFSGPNYQWCNFEMPGDTVYIKFTHESSSDWFYKFTVLGSRFGRFDTGYRILNGLLSTSFIIHSLPVNEIWSSLVHVSCKQIGQKRLKSIHLLLLLLHSQFKSANCTHLSLDLGLLCPLWRLNRKMAEDFLDTVCLLPPLMRALTELFFYAENLAMEWNIESEYVASLIDDEDIISIISKGLESIAVLSYSIGYQNKATECLQTSKHLPLNCGKDKSPQSLKTSIIV